MTRAGRRLVAFAVALAGGYACANQGPPPGGPPDASPPLVVSVTPSNMAADQKVNAVRLRFDEVISETPRGARDLSDLVFISPRSGDARVSWGRNEIEIKPAKGWKPNTVYSVQIKPGIVDLRGNALDTAIKIVFSTGGPIPATKVVGAVFDWGAAKPAGQAVVEAMAADSTRYQVVADENGRYTLEHVPPGPYLLRAFVDRNNNKELDPLELWDSVRTVITAASAAEFYAFQHDTVGLRIQDIALSDSNRAIKITFDKPYVSNQYFVPAMIRLLRSDSSRIPVKSVVTATQKLFNDSVAAKTKADSAEKVRRAKEDTSPAARARLDSLMRVRRADSVAAVERAKREADRVAAREAAKAGRRVVPKDTTPPPKMTRPRVYTELFVTLDSALPPSKQFRLQVLSVRSLAGEERSPGRVFSTPRPDTTKRAATDTSKRTPGDTAGARRPPPAPAVRRDTTRR